MLVFYNCNKYLRQVSIKILCVRVSVCAHAHMRISADINGPYLKVSLLTFHINLYLHRMMSVPPFSENGGVKNRKMDPRCSCWEEKEACLNINQAGNTRIHNQITLMATKVHSPHSPAGWNIVGAKLTQQSQLLYHGFRVV